MSHTVQRQAARVLLVDDSDRVLLLHGCDPANASAGRWWFTPGGGLDPGELAAEAASRELAEETGLRASAEELGPVVHERTAQFRFDGQDYRQDEVFFLLRIASHDVDTSGFTALELASVTGHRWWPRCELAGTDQRIYPRDLEQVLERALLGTVSTGRPC